MVDYCTSVAFLCIEKNIYKKYTGNRKDYNDTFTLSDASIQNAYVELSVKYTSPITNNSFEAQLEFQARR